MGAPAQGLPGDGPDREGDGRPTGLDDFGLPSLRAAWDSSPALVAVVRGPQHELIYQNTASKEKFGVRELGKPLEASFADVTRAGIEPLDEVLRTGLPVEVGRHVVGVHDVSGDEVVMRYVLAPWGEPGAPPEGVVITALDVSAEAAWERSSVRSRLVGEIADRMNGTADSRVALTILTQALVPEIADLAAVYIARPGQRAVGSPAGPDRPVALAVGGSLAHLGPPPETPTVDGPSPWDATLAAGVTVLIPIDATTVRLIAPDPASRTWLADARASSIAVVPMVGAGAVAGALVLVSAGDRAPFAPHDLPFLEGVAARAGAAVAHVQAFRRQRDIAVDLQRALLPASPPAMPGLAAAALYLAGAEDVEVGGDWWDVVDLGAGRVGVGVGDVSGRGLPAAVVMGQARAAMRAAALADLAPGELLSIIDTQMAELVPVRPSEIGAPPRFATALYAVFEPLQSHLRIANAGHVPPLIRSVGGAVRQTAVPPGAPLGLQIGGWEELLVPLGPGETLALYSDGLVESRRQDIDEGIAVLADALERFGDAPDLDATARRLLQATGRAEGYDDDIVLVLLRADPSAFPRATYATSVAGPAEIAAARRTVGAMLSEQGHDEVAPAAEHVLSELLANALEHGAGDAQLHVQISGVRVVIEVTDYGVARPVRREAQIEDERGRGMLVTDALATRWGVRRRHGGKTVWAEIVIARGGT